MNFKTEVEEKIIHKGNYLILKHLFYKIKGED